MTFGWGAPYKRHLNRVSGLTTRPTEDTCSGGRRSQGSWRWSQFWPASGQAHRQRPRRKTDTVKVGIIYSRTGALAAYGAEYIQGLRYGLAYATKGTNTVNGHKIELTIVDDGTDPVKAVSAAKDLIGKGYKIIGGSTSSGVALQLAPLAAQNQVLFLSGPAATDAIQGINKYTFRSGRQSYQDVLAASSFLGGGGGKNVTVFAQDSAFGLGNFLAVNQVMGTSVARRSAVSSCPCRRRTSRRSPSR